jgi:hypothetical protein
MPHVDSRLEKYKLDVTLFAIGIGVGAQYVQPRLIAPTYRKAHVCHRRLKIYRFDYQALDGILLRCVAGGWIVYFLRQFDGKENSFLGSSW